MRKLSCALTGKARDPLAGTTTVAMFRAHLGEVSEWLKVPDSKSGVAKVTEGSNPSLSAT